MSTSVASLELEPIEVGAGIGTRFTHVEQGVFLDRFWADGPHREAGTSGILDALGVHVA
jgi:hypothetical protein